MDKEQVRQAIENDVENAIESEFGACNVELPDGSEVEYKWRGGVAVVAGVGAFAVSVVWIEGSEEEDDDEDNED